jgi:hypothetical protein
MAEKKNMTRAQALQFAMDNIITNCGDDLEKCGGDVALEVLNKMYEQVTKPRKAAVTKARKVNENLADKVTKLVADNHDTAITTKDVVALGLPEITTTQKAAAVLRVACELGKFEKVIDGKKVGYKKVVTE